MAFLNHALHFYWSVPRCCWPLARLAQYAEYILGFWHIERCTCEVGINRTKKDILKTGKPTSMHLLENIMLLWWLDIASSIQQILQYTFAVTICTPHVNAEKIIRFLT